MMDLIKKVKALLEFYKRQSVSGQPPGLRGQQGATPLVAKRSLIV